MSIFPLNRMPYSLKTLIFSNFEPVDSLKFLKTNRELRHYLLNHGPFPEKVNTVKITCINPQIIAEGVICEQLQLLIDTSSQSFSCYHGHPREGDPEEHEGIPIKITDSPLFRRIKHCAHMLLIFSLDGESSGQPQLLVNDFLPRPRVLQRFLIFTLYSGLCVPILRTVNPRIESYFHFQVSGAYDNVVAEEIMTFLRENTRDCREIEIDGLPRQALRCFIDQPQERRHDFREIRIYQWDNSFAEAIRMMIQNGIPSRDPGAVFSIRTRPIDLGPVLETLKRLPGCHEVDKATGLAEILPKFGNDPFSDPGHLAKQGGQFYSAIYYRRKFTDTIEHYYVLLKVLRNYALSFYATSAEIV